MTNIEEAEKEFVKLLNGKALPTKQLTEVAEHYFIVGYQEGKDKAKETLYTEEQLKQAFIFYAERPIVDIKYLEDDFRYFIELNKLKKNNYDINRNTNRTSNIRI